MHLEQQENGPYLDWSLDRLKIGLVLFLFIVLILLPFVAPLEPAAGTQAPLQSAGVAAVRETTPDSSSDLSPTDTPDTGSSTVDAEGVQEVVPGATASTPSDVEAQASDEIAAATATGAQMPLTLAQIGPNAVVLARSLAHLEGTAAAGKTVEIRMQYVPAQATAATTGGTGMETVLGTSLANQFGLWTFAATEPFSAGQYVVTLRQINADGDVELVSSPVVLTVLPEGEVGPPSLATPMIRFPTTAAQLRHGPIVFDGTGLPGARLQLYVNNRLLGETLIGRDGEWEMTAPDGIAAGVYIAQVATLSPNGDVMAESAPVAFAVVEAPLGMAPVHTDSTPVLPLRVSEAKVTERPHGALVLTGVATPHSSVAAWVDGMPVQYANTRIDGGWRLWFLRYHTADEDRLVEVRTHLREVIQVEQAHIGTSVSQRYEPIFLFPRSGETLTTRRPLLSGVAPPRTEISLLVNRVLVASVVTDEQGRWAYQVEEPLPSGRVALTAMLGAQKQPVTAGAEEDAVMITVAPQLQALGR